MVNLRCSHDRCADKQTYELRVVCSNCRWAGLGILTGGHAFTDGPRTCPRCLCSTLTRDWN